MNDLPLTRGNTDGCVIVWMRFFSFWRVHIQAKTGWLVALEGLIKTTLGIDTEDSLTAERGAVLQEQVTWKQLLRDSAVQTQDE